MTILFSEIITVQTFDSHGYYPIKMRKCKDFDGPNNFSLLWNQLLILLDNNLINDKNTLHEKFNSELLRFYQSDILKEINHILYKFLELGLPSVTLYYDTYIIKNNKTTIQKLINLYELIQK
jgi:hypothetical protein|tara:strand:+ start:147 stop:512 length:366 start_codon:yes stop_codon:yes gene_type:complete